MKLDNPFFKMRASPVAFAAMLFLFALALRAGYTFFLKAHYPYFDHPGEDTSYYQQWALQLASETPRQREAFWGMPLYPYFLSFLYRLSSGNTQIIRALLLGIGAFNCVLLYHFVRRTFHENAARLAGLLMAANFLMIYYDWLMNSVTVIITLSLVSALVLVDLSERAKYHQWALSGVLLGMLALADGKAVVLIVLVAIYFLWTARRSAWMKTGMLLIGAVAVIFSVSLRNRIVSGDWILISAQTGIGLYIGNNPHATGLYSNPGPFQPDHAGQDRDQKIVAELAAGRSLSAGEVSAYWSGQVLGFMRDHPRQALLLFMKKAWLFFTDTPLADDIDLKMQHRWKGFLNWPPYLMLCPLALIGLGCTRHQLRKPVAIAMIFIMAQFIFTILAFLYTKHRASVYPFFIMGASLAFYWLVDQFRQKNVRVIVLSGVFLITWAVLFFPPELDPRTIELHRAWKNSVIAEQQGDLDRAEQQALIAARLNPCPTSLANLGSIYLQKNEPQKAIGVLKQVAAMAPENVNAYYNLGIAYELIREDGLAEMQYRHVLRLISDDSNALVRLGALLDRHQRCAEAGTVFARLSEALPDLALSIKNKFFSTCIK